MLSYYCGEHRSPDRYTNNVPIVMTYGYRDDVFTISFFPPY
jgi:hypothetical protein